MISYPQVIQAAKKYKNSTKINPTDNEWDDLCVYTKTDASGKVSHCIAGQMVEDLGGQAPPEDFMLVCDTGEFPLVTKLNYTKPAIRFLRDLQSQADSGVFADVDGTGNDRLPWRTAVARTLKKYGES